MKYIGLLLIGMMSATHTMDKAINPLATTAYSPHLHRAHSDSALYDINANASDTESETESDATAWSTDTDSHELDELEQLARNTYDPNIKLNSGVRGFSLARKKKSHRKKHHTHGFTTHAATYDDVVCMIQFHSKAALTEARTLNKEYLISILSQLNAEGDTMRIELNNQVAHVLATLENLDTRLQGVEKLLPSVKRLLKQDGTLSTKYEQTCQNLTSAFERYAHLVGIKESALIMQSKENKIRLQSIRQSMVGVLRQITQIGHTTQNTNEAVRGERARNKIMRYVSGAGLIGLILWLVASANQPMDTNASLQQAL